MPRIGLFKWEMYYKIGPANINVPLEDKGAHRNRQ